MRGARARCASGYRMLCGAARRRAATGASVGLPCCAGPRGAPRRPGLAGEHCGARRRSRPLYGLAALILRASAAFHALGRCGSAVCAAPPISGKQPLGALAAE